MSEIAPDRSSTGQAPAGLTATDGGLHGPVGPHGSTALARDLGVGAIVFMVVAAAAPLAVVVGNAPVLLTTSGNAAAPLYFAVATVILTLFSVGFTLMSRRIPNAGAFYSYIQAGLGRVLGTGAATLALGSYVLLQVGVNSYFGYAASSAVDRFTGATVPWWVFALGSLVVTAFLGYRDIELSSRVLGILLVAETLTVVIFDLAVFAQGGAGFSVDPLSPSVATSGAPGLGLMFAVFCFIGFEATAVFRNEARDPDRTIPRATYVSVIGIGVVYAISAYAVVSGAGADKAVGAAVADPGNVVLDLAASYASPLLRDVMQVLLVTSFFACVLSFHNVLTRYQFTLATKRVFPSRLAAIHPDHRAPSRSSAVVSVVTITLQVGVVLAGLDPVAQAFTWFSGAATLGLIVLMGLTSVAVVVFFRRYPSDGGLWSTTVAPAAATVALLGVLALVVDNFALLVGGEGPANGFFVVLAGFLLLGATLSLVMRRRDPAAFEQLEDDVLR